jgi:hypothetical protein
MYPMTAVIGGSAAALPFIGLNVGWMIVAGATLFAVGAALFRIMPRRLR